MPLKARVVAAVRRQRGRVGHLRAGVGHLGQRSRSRRPGHRRHEGVPSREVHALRGLVPGRLQGVDRGVVRRDTEQPLRCLEIGQRIDGNVRCLLAAMN